MSLPRVLVVEDGHEYSDNLERFLSSDFHFERAGDGPQALERLAEGDWQAVYLDMRFDRAERLLGDLEATAARFGGDLDRARRFLENHQGTFVLDALRRAGHSLPVLMSYDFDSEPRRFANLLRVHGPLAYLTDSATPGQIRDALRTLLLV